MALNGTLSTIPPWINNTSNIPTPCYLIHEKELERNLKCLKHIKDQTNCKILIALKGYSTYSTFPLIKTYLDGVTASSIYEAKLGFEEFNKNVHGHSIAMHPDDAKQFASLCTTISANSIHQLTMFQSIKNNHQSIGLRINPNISTVRTPIYDPCAKFSRLGVPIDDISNTTLQSVDGIHFHALCEQNTDALEKVLNKIEHMLGDQLKSLKWMNWGGGHHITQKGYQVDHLIELINHWKRKYNLDIILEPGEAIGLNCGYYIATVLDIIKNKKEIAICDISATCHMPDILEYPYRPNILNANKENESPHSYIISGNTCLAGDIIGNYSFDKKLTIGSRIIFTDMAHYTIVKTSNFNGMKQPSIGIINKQNKINILSKSCYHNFKERLS